MGYLSILSTSSSTSTVALDIVGVIDWIKWEAPATVVTKSGGGNLFSAFSALGTGVPTGYTTDVRIITWTGGTPTATGSSINGVFSGNPGGTGQGFRITAPASTTLSQVILYYGLFNGQGVLTCTLSDGSAPPITINSAKTAASTSADFNASILFQANSGSQTLTIDWTLGLDITGTGANVTINGALLSPSPILAITQQPSNVISYVGGTASFSVIAALSSGTLSYQWKVNGTNVSSGSGGTTANFTTGTLSLSDNNSIYTCVVTDTNGSVTSFNALLLVKIVSTTAWFRA